jgi:hypothetical protein
MTSIAFAGRSGRQSMQPSDVALARQVRQAVQQLAGRSRLTGDALDRQALALVKTQYRRAIDLLGTEVVIALTRRLDPGACSWCKVRELCKNNRKPLPQPAPTLRAALGSQCPRCEVAWNAAAVAEREQPHVDGLVSAGFKPQASGNLRSAEQIADYRRRLDALDRAKLPPRPATRKTPVPSYYQPRRQR